MNSFAIRTVFSPNHVVAWNDARRLVDMVGLDNVRCHELARAVHRMLPPALTGGRKMLGAWTDGIDVQDGLVGAVEHSWLQFTESGMVLDVYRPGCHPQVLLIDRFLAKVDYKQLEMRTDIDDSIIVKLCAMMTR